MEWWDKIAAMLRNATPEVRKKVEAAMQEKRTTIEKGRVNIKRPGKRPWVKRPRRNK